MRITMYLFAIPVLLLLPMSLWAGCANQSIMSTSAISDTVKAEADCGAAIVYIVEEDMIFIEAQFTNSTMDEQPIRYKLRTEKAGKSGTSSNSQGGAEVVSTETTVTLSKVGLDYTNENRYAITLTILDKEGHTICEVSKTIGQ